MSGNAFRFGPAGSRVQKYPAIACPPANSVDSIDITILQPGETGDVWHLDVMGQKVFYKVAASDTAALVAAGLRAAATVIAGQVTSGATTHVILTRSAAVASLAAPELMGRLFCDGKGTHSHVEVTVENQNGRGECRVEQSAV